MANRRALVIQASGGFQRIQINSQPNDGTICAIHAANNGLDGTGVDVDFFTANNIDDLANVIGIVFGSTPLQPAANADIAGNAQADFLYVDFEPNDATVGTVDLTITFK